MPLFLLQYVWINNLTLLAVLSMRAMNKVLATNMAIHVLIILPLEVKHLKSNTQTQNIFVVDLKTKKSLSCGTYSVERTVWNVQCGTYSVERTVWNLQCGTYNV